jgi:hypothetical protein
VQQADDLHVLVVSGVAENVGDCLGVGEPGLDFFGFGEHQTRSMPLSSPTAMVNAAAASTQRIGLGTTVTVLSTDEPIRVFEQRATAAAIAPGRIEAVAGRGSSKSPSRSSISTSATTTTRL